MKKITLAFILLTFAVQAQDFPSPYCNIPNTSVEAITSVTIGGTIITNSNTTSILIDKTSTEVVLVPGDTYTITVEGFTSGGFDNNIVAFIDWNHNDVLDDTGEIYAIGTLTNSTGNDGISVSFDITIPSDAVLAPTRIRITKTYTDDYTTAIVNPCEIEMEIPGYGNYPGFGQALDFTLYPSILGVNSFEVNALSVYPIPTQNILNIEYKSLLNEVKIYNLLGQEVYAEKTASSHLQLDIASLATGAYVVKLFTDEGQHSFRVIKQ